MSAVVVVFFQRYAKSRPDTDKPNLLMADARSIRRQGHGSGRCL